jgi:hypothetical protein
MKRRAFCRSAVAMAMAASLHGTRAWAEAERAAGKILSDVNLKTRTGGETVVARAAVVELKEAMYGQLLMPDSASYEDVRKIWNGMFDRRPALIARCAGASDVVDAVNFARAHDLLVSVRSGGHSISGKSVCEGGLMIDLAPMQGVRVQPSDKTARVQAGVLLNKLDHEGQRLGLATTTGTTSHTGLAGLTLGGGLGRLARVYGLTCDNLLAADIVTADGRSLQVSEQENADLFWGIRGGGGNFGIVTSFKYQLHSLGPKVIGGALLYPMKQAREVLSFFSEYSMTAPRELNVSAVVVRPPGSKGMVIIGVTYIGSASQAERVLRPLREFAKPMVDDIGEVDYAYIQHANDKTLPHGLNYYMKSGFLAEGHPGLIDVLAEGFEPSSSRSYVAVWTQLGGQIAEVGQADTAFAHRDAEYDLLVGSSWRSREDSEENVAWMRGFWNKVLPYTSGFYVNNAMDEDHKRIEATYGINYARLLGLKNKYDPANFFRLNANIEPNV